VAVLLVVWFGIAPVPTAQQATGRAAAPQRIVSFVPAATEMLFAIGAGDRVVGVSSYGRFPPAVLTLPQVGGLLDPHVERVLALKPDLVVAYETQRELRLQLDRAAIPHFDYVHRDLADVTRTVRSIGVRVGAREAAERVATDIERQLDAIRQRAVGPARPRTLLIIGREAGSLRRILASGGYGFLHDLLELAGGVDVLSDIRRESVELNVEAILARAPDTIVELRYGQALHASDLAQLRRDWDPLAAVPAVRRGAVHVLQGDEFVVPGPRVVEAAHTLATVLRE
jgi:iron complex transport system substrate-binding protein